MSWAHGSVSLIGQANTHCRISILLDGSINMSGPRIEGALWYFLEVAFHFSLFLLLFFDFFLSARSFSLHRSGRNQSEQLLFHWWIPVDD